MSLKINPLRTAVFAALLAGAAAGPLALAGPPGDGGPGEGRGCGHGPPMGPGLSGFGGGPGGGLGGDFEGSRPPPYLHGIDLTDEQQDKVFALLHAAAPGLREQSKAAHQAHEALRQLARSPKFDDATAASLAATEAKADSALTLTRLRVDHGIYALLTAEQRAAVEKQEREHDEHRPGGPLRGGMPPGGMPLSGSPPGGMPPSGVQPSGSPPGGVPPSGSPPG